MLVVALRGDVESLNCSRRAEDLQRDYRWQREKQQQQLTEPIVQFLESTASKMKGDCRTEKSFVVFCESISKICLCFQEGWLAAGLERTHSRMAMKSIIKLMMFDWGMLGT